MSGPDGSNSADHLDRLTDFQWYMYQQRNVAFFAAFSTRSLVKSDLAEIAHGLVALAPQLADGFRGMSDQSPLPANLIEQITEVEQVDGFEDFPDPWIGAASDINDRPDLPLFRIRVATRKGGADTTGRASFVLVHVSHALVEGADSALLSRSRRTAHDQPLALPMSTTTKLPASANSSKTWSKFAGKLMGGPAAIGHLLGANLIDLRPGPYGFASRVADRRAISRHAKTLGVRQRPLLFALGLIGLFGADALAAKKSVSTTYSTIDAGGEARSGGFMHMRMLFATFPTAPGLASLAKSIEAALTANEQRPAGFGDALSASALATHRRLYRRLHGLYRRQVFSFMPYDAVLGLIPPHRLDGPLTEHLQEPVYAGAALEGSNACVIVPGREKISFNFFAQTKQLSFVEETDVLLRQLSAVPQ